MSARCWRRILWEREEIGTVTSPYYACTFYERADDEHMRDVRALALVIFFCSCKDSHRMICARNKANMHERSDASLLRERLLKRT